MILLSDIVGGGHFVDRVYRPEANNGDEPQMEPWQFSLEEYIREGEPERAEKSYVWQTAIGLQAVDGLKTSDYLLETAKEHIEGNIDMETVKRRIDSYYEEQSVRRHKESGAEEADKVSARIAELLVERAFQFSPAEFISIHHRLFEGIFPHAGMLRTYNITKREWVLNGETVYYASADSLRDTLEYDFAQEKTFPYRGLSLTESIRHLAGFISGIWQIHPFGEGNTRTTAVFAIKYLRSFGFDAKNELFAENSWYFRNALVRANYTNLSKGIHAAPEFLEMFFENLLLDAKNPLKNRYLHIDFASAQSATDNSKCKNCTLNCTLEELSVLRIMKEQPAITQRALAERIGKSPRTVKTLTVELQEKGLLTRENGKRNGIWRVAEEID